MLSTQEITPRKIRVMLVDDSAILLRETVPFLLQHPNVELVGVVSMAANALAQVQMLKPDVVLLDVTIRGMQGLPVISQLAAVKTAVAIIVLDEIHTDSIKHAAIKHGAAAFVSREHAATQLVPAILALAPSNNFVELTLDQAALGFHPMYSG